MGFEEELKGHMEVKDITQRLFDQSDAELQAEIDAAFEPVRRLITDGCVGSIRVGKTEVDRHEALHALKVKAFDMHQDARRNRKISEFMAKVGQLGEEIDELRNALNR